MIGKQQRVTLFALLFSSFVWTPAMAADAVNGAKKDAPAPAPVLDSNPNPTVLDLPTGPVYSPELIYKTSYPLEGRNEVAVHYSYLFGDKYLNTMGALITDQYHFSEKWGVELGLGLYGRSANSEFTTLQNTQAEPYAYDPSWLVKATAVYNAVYGKVLIGNSITHFRIDAELGVVMANEKSVNSGNLIVQKSFGSNLDGSNFTKVGPILGIDAIFYLGKHFTVDVGTDLMITGSSPVDPTAGSRKTWLFNFGVGYVF